MTNYNTNLTMVSKAQVSPSAYHVLLGGAKAQFLTATTVVSEPSPLIQHDEGINNVTLILIMIAIAAIIKRKGKTNERREYARIHYIYHH